MYSRPYLSLKDPISAVLSKRCILTAPRLAFRLSPRVLEIYRKAEMSIE